MGYLEKLPCGCVVFGRDALVDPEDRIVPVVIRMGCPIHDDITNPRKKE